MEEPPLYASTYELDTLYEDLDDNNVKRQTAGFYAAKDPQVPDIWSMFSTEWGQRVTRRKRSDH